MKAVFLLVMSLFIFYSPQSFGLVSEDDQVAASPEGSSDMNLDKKFNIKTNVGIIFFGLYNLSLEYKVHPHITISGTGLIGSFEQESNDDSATFDIKTKGFNLMANYHFSEAYTNSIYASAIAGYLKIDAELKNFSISASASVDTPYIGAEIGYIHYFNRLNITVGAGGSKTFKDEETEIKIGNFNGSAVVQVHLNYHINASLGWVF